MKLSAPPTVESKVVGKEDESWGMERGPGAVREQKRLVCTWTNAIHKITHLELGNNIKTFALLIVCGIRIRRQDEKIHAILGGEEVRICEDPCSSSPAWDIITCDDLTKIRESEGEKRTLKV